MSESVKPHHISKTKTTKKESMYTVMTSVDNGPITRAKEQFVNVITNANGTMNGSLSSLDDFTMDIESDTKYSLVRTPSLRRSKKEVIDPNGGVKIDTYSVGVLMATTVSSLLKF